MLFKATRTYCCVHEATKNVFKFIKTKITELLELSVTCCAFSIISLCIGYQANYGRLMLCLVYVKIDRAVGAIAENRMESWNWCYRGTANTIQHILWDVSEDILVI